MEKMNNNKNTALLVMDVQQAIVGLLQESAALLDTLVETIEAARNNRIEVIYVVIGFRKGYPEVSTMNKSFAGMRNSGRNFDTEEAMRPAAQIAPMQEDIIITKKRVSAFAGSDLEVVLRSKGIQHLVLT